MRYVRIDENLPDHPKLHDVPKKQRTAVLGLYVAAICYASRHLTDGFVPAGFFDEANAKQLASVCLSTGLFDAYECDGKSGYLIHDFLDFNRSKSEREQLSKKRKTAGRKGGKAKRKQSASDVLKQNEATLTRARTRNDNDNGLKRPLSNDKSTSISGSDTRPVENSKPLSSSTKIPDSVLGYWSDKAGRDATPDDRKSLASLCKHFPGDIVNLAIGQAVAQGSAADNFALITTIAKAEVSR